MSKLDEWVKYFSEKQAEIVTLHEQTQKKLATLQEEGEAKIQEIKNGFEISKGEILAELNTKRAAYKAEMRLRLGICDGENADVLSLVKAIKAVVEANQS